MSGGFKANFAALDTAASDIMNSGKQIESRLDELDRQLAPLRSDWTGAASEAYTHSKQQWTKAIQDMNLLLNDIGRAVSQSGSDYSGQENANRNLWG